MKFLKKPKLLFLVFTCYIIFEIIFFFIWKLHETQANTFYCRMLCLPFLITYTKSENKRAAQLRLHNSPPLRIYFSFWIFWSPSLLFSFTGRKSWLKSIAYPLTIHAEKSWITYSTPNNEESRGKLSSFCNISLTMWNWLQLHETAFMWLSHNNGYNKDIGRFLKHCYLWGHDSIWKGDRTKHMNNRKQIASVHRRNLKIS